MTKVIPFRPFRESDCRLGPMDPRYWDPVASEWRDGARAERARVPVHVPTLLEARGLTPAAVDGRIMAYIETIRAAIRESRKRRGLPE